MAFVITRSFTDMRTGTEYSPVTKIVHLLAEKMFVHAGACGYKYKPTEHM